MRLQACEGSQQSHRLEDQYPTFAVKVGAGPAGLTGNEHMRMQGQESCNCNLLSALLHQPGPCDCQSLGFCQELLHLSGACGGQDWNSVRVQTTPHGSRSTNMSLQDSFALGECMAASMQDIPEALQAFQSRRLEQTSREVMSLMKKGERMLIAANETLCSFSLVGCQQRESSPLFVPIQMVAWRNTGQSSERDTLCQMVVVPLHPSKAQITACWPCL